MSFANYAIGVGFAACGGHPADPSGQVLGAFHCKQSSSCAANFVARRQMRTEQPPLTPLWSSLVGVMARTQQRLPEKKEVTGSTSVTSKENAHGGTSTARRRD